MKIKEIKIIGRGIEKKNVKMCTAESNLFVATIKASLYFHLVLWNIISGNGEGIPQQCSQGP